MSHNARVPEWGKIDQLITMRSTEYRVHQGHKSYHRQKVSDARCDYNADHCAQEFDKLVNIVSRLDHAKRYHSNKAMGEIQKDNERLMQKMYIAMADREQTRMEELYKHDQRLLKATMSKENLRQKRENLIRAENDNLSHKIQTTKSHVPAMAVSEEHAASVQRLSRHRRPVSARGAPRTPPRSPSRQSRPTTPNTARGSAGGSRPSSATYHRRLMHPARDPLVSAAPPKENKWWQAHGERFAPGNEAVQTSLLERAKAEAVEKLHSATVALGAMDISLADLQSTSEARNRDWWRTVSQEPKAVAQEDEILQGKDTSLMEDSSVYALTNDQEEAAPSKPATSSDARPVPEKEEDYADDEDTASTVAPSPQVRTERNLSSPTSIPSAVSPCFIEDEETTHQVIEQDEAANLHALAQASPAGASQLDESRLPSNQHARLRYIQAASAASWSPQDSVPVAAVATPIPTDPRTENSSPRPPTVVSGAAEFKSTDGSPQPGFFRILEARRTVA